MYLLSLQADSTNQIHLFSEMVTRLSGFFLRDGFSSNTWCSVAGLSGRNWRNFLDIPAVGDT